MRRTRISLSPVSGLARVHHRPRRLVALAALALLTSVLVAIPTSSLAAGPDVFINEIHYDNSSTDSGEAIEVAGPAGTDLTGWSIVLYNGSNGATYDTDVLSGAIPNLQNGFGAVVLDYPSNGIQNGSPDGVALVDATSYVVQFLSYEGSITATNGPASGLTSVDIGVSEPSSTAVGDSLQLVGTGTQGGDFTWAVAQANTFGAVNTGQTFEVPPDTPPSVIGTDPANAASAVAVDSNITITFNEPVTVATDWYGIACSTSNPGIAVSTTDSTTYTLNPDADFAYDDSCTVTVVAAAVSDHDEPFDLMIDDFAFTFTVEGVPAAPSPIVVNEIDYDQPGTDTAEFVELMNTSEAAVDLTGWELLLVNGNGGASYSPSPIDLSGFTLAAGDYFVVCGNADNTPNCDLVSTTASNLIQNGAPDAVALYAPGGVLADTVSYEGNTVAPYTEAAGAPADTGGSASIGISRSPDGKDTNNNSVDFATRCITPGEPNSTSADGCYPPQCTVVPVLISYVQGSGSETPCDGAEVTIQGIVVGDYEGPDGLNGFYVEEEFDDWDDDPATSEGVFVYNPYQDSVNLGDLVTVVGTATEYQGQTQIGYATIAVDGTSQAVPAVSAALPVQTADHLERYEGMLVTFDQTLYVTEIYRLGRFGQVLVSSGNRLDQPTAVAEPGAPASVVAAANELNQLIIDDNLNVQNPDPILFGGGGNPLTAANPLRGGDTLVDVVGVMTYGWGGNSSSPNAYRLRPVGDLSDSGLVPGGVVPVFNPANPRPTSPPGVGGSLNAASFNVLNYFTTLDTTPGSYNGPYICGPNLDQECRGANTPEELVRQRDKLLSALQRLDADVVGLMELENTTGVEPLADIVEGLNDRLGAGTYAYIDTGTIGTDVIKVGIIYKPGFVTPVLDYAILDSSSNPDFDDNLNRPALAQSFVENASGGIVTVVVNHLKSKSCRDASGLNADQGDGQGCYNLARTQAASAEVAWLASKPTGIVDPDYLVLGDLNAYAMEDPVDAFTNAGYVDLIQESGGSTPYSYVFDGSWGYLDYALASPSLAGSIAGTSEYHINSDEAGILDYNMEYKTVGQLSSLYAADEYRTSDHDPVIVGLDLTVTPRQAKDHSIGVLSELLPTGSWYYDFWIKKAIKSIEDSLNPAYWVDDFHLTDKGKKVFDKERWAVRTLMWVHGSVEREVDAVILALFTADQELASIAIAEATAAGGSEWYLSRAEREMKRAHYDWDGGRPDKAINHYKKAWEYAGRSLNCHWWHCGR